MMEQNTSQNIKKASDLSKYLQKLKVDSFKLRVPIQQVKYISTTFCEEYKKLFISTGEIEEHINLEKYKTDITDGITSRIGVVVCRINKHESQEFIYFQINSKMLKGEYLHGITPDTIKIAYEYLMSLNIVFVEYNDFRNGFISDIDFAYDIKISPGVMINLISRIYSKIREDRYKYVDKPFKKDSNVGIQFNKRDKAVPSIPNIKIYHKGVEMEHHSREFYDTYLSGYDLSEYGRLEYTLKNAKHQKHLGISIKTLNQLLDMNYDTMEQIVLRSIPECYVEKSPFNKDCGKLSPNDGIIVDLIQAMILSGSDKMNIYSTVFRRYASSDADRINKHRVKKTIDNLMSYIDTGTKITMKKNKEVNDILRVLKFDGFGI
jgi:hypothetical protein